MYCVKEPLLHSEPAAVMCLTIWQFDLKTQDRVIHQAYGGQEPVGIELLDRGGRAAVLLIWPGINSNLKQTFQTSKPFLF